VRFPGRNGEYTLDQFHKLFHENDLLKRALAGEEFKPPVVTNFPPTSTAKPAFTTDSITAKVLGDDPVDEIRIIDALSKKETDRDHNGVIEASELYATVKRAVVEATEGRQTPWFARNDLVGDFVPF
jgi:hypothetical protein